MLRPRLRIPRIGLPRPLPSLRRYEHSVPRLAYPNQGQDGIAYFMSKEQFDLAWTQYMQFTIDKLNALTAGTEMEQMDTLKILKKTAREPSQAPIFNYASMAHNNHFFFKQLREKRDAPNPVPIPPRLKAELEDSFSSIDTLKSEMILTANAMFGPGFVWLVKNGKSNNYKILATYLAGSPYSAAHWRRQGVDMNTEAGPTSSGDSSISREFLGRTQLAAGATTGAQWSKLAPGGIDVIPLLCVSTWEHAWLRDYGVGVGGRGGKRAFLELWWNAIDWDEVYGISHPRGSESSVLKPGAYFG